MATTAPVIIPIKTPGIRQLEKLERQMEAVEKDFNKVAVTAPKATNQIKRFGDQAKRTESKVGGLTKSLRGFLTAAALLGTAKFVIGKTSELETQTRSLKVLTGELETAQKIVAELQSFAAVTPFTSSELIESAKRLKAFGVDTEKLVATTQRLADVSGATGARLNEVATAYGQIQAKGRLQGEELLQLQERGIALQDELQKMYGLTGQEFSKALQKGQFSAEAVEVAIVRLTEKGGKYADGAISQSDTLAGKFSTLIDGIENIARTLGNVLSPALKTILDQAIGVVNSINAALAAGRRMQQFGIDAKGRDELFRQAGQEAEELAKLRGGGVIDPAEFTRLRNERFKDLIEGFGYETGQIEVEIKPIIKENDIPELLKQNTKTSSSSSGSSSASSKTSKLERQREELERQFEAGEDIKRNLENQMMLLRATTDLDKERLKIAIDLDNQIRQIQQTAAPSQQEGLIITATEEARLKDMIAIATQGGAGLGKSLAEGLPKVNEELTQAQQLLKGAGDIVANNLTQGIEGLIKGTATWGDMLSNILSQLGSMFISAGIGGIGTPGQAGSGSGLFGALFNGKAKGGPISAGNPYLVGEQGPEIVVPSSGGTVIPNDYFSAAAAALSGGGSGDAGDDALGLASGPGYSGASGAAAFEAARGAMASSASQQQQRVASDALTASNPFVNGSSENPKITYESQVINQVEYVSVAQAQAMSDQAAKRGAQMGEARTIGSLRNKPASRKRAGVG